MPDATILDRFIVAVAPMIDRTHWRVPFDIVSVIAAGQAEHEDGWCRLSRRDIAKKAGCSDGWVWQLLGQPGSLWRTQWVIQRGRGGGGRRPTELQVILDIGRWRGVPWKEPDPEVRMLRLQAALEPALAALAAQEAAGAFWRGLIPRQRGSVLARSYTAPKRGAADQDKSLQRNDASQRKQPLFGAVLDRAKTDPSMVRSSVGHRATTNGAGAPSTSPRGPAVALGGSGDEDLSLPGPQRQQREGFPEPQHPDLLDRLVVAVNTKCAPRFVGPASRLMAQLARVAAMVAAGDIEILELERAVANACPTWWPPMVVDHLERLARGTGSVDAAGRPTNLNLEGRLAAAKRLIAACVADGGEPSESLLAEVEEWQTQLDQRKELTGGRQQADAPQCESTSAA